jgi:hypothetical protein
VLDELAGHLRGDDLARLVHTVAFAAADERRTSLSDGLSELADRAGLSATDADTSFGNALRILEQGKGEPMDDAARVLLATLLARGVALSPPSGAEAEGRVAEVLIWLATQTPLDALTALDAAMGERAEGLWTAIGGLVRRADEGSLPELGRAGALIAAAALRSSTSAAARVEAAALAAEARDPVVRALLRDAPLREPGAPEGGREGGDEQEGRGEPTHVRGEIVPPPRGLIPLVLMAVTGILLVLHLGRLLGRLLLRYRRPAELTITSRGLTVRSSTQLFGRTLKEGETHIPAEALQRVSREVRYPRAGLYAGLVSLGLGTYVGVSLFVDGARAGSPELLGVGALFLAIGAALDFAFSHLAAKAKGRCRVIIVPRKGPVVALGGADPALADAALGRLVRA